MDLKKIVSRSFERKIQIQQYEPASFFASYTEEVYNDTSSEELKRISVFLYDLAKGDVEQSILEYKQKLAQERIVEQKKQDYKDDNDL